jgi:hypothetical protein
MSLVTILVVLLGSLYLYVVAYYAVHETIKMIDHQTPTHRRILRYLIILFFWWALLMKKGTGSNHPYWHNVIGGFLIAFSLVELARFANEPSALLLIFPLTAGLILVF